MIIPVVLSGGAGTRLWPLSRELFPKQLFPLTGEKTMLQETVTRLHGLADLGAPLVVCNENHRFLVAEQLSQINVVPSAIVLEPVGRNTAPAVAIAALLATADGSDPTLLILPADHLIADNAALHAAVATGAALAREGSLLTFGVVPDKAETGYGYIRADKSRTWTRQGQLAKPSAEHDAAAHAVAEFVEKPDLATAQAYVASGNYFWNSGMFMFQASTFLKELEKFAPAILDACRQSLAAAVRDLDFTRLDAAAFAACPGNSIDYAVMEKTANAVVIPLDAGWNDVGSWSALWETGAKDADGNVFRGDVLTKDTRNCYLHAGTRMLAAVGVTDHVIVETGDAVLVAHKDRVQDVKAIVDQLKREQRHEALIHCRVNRPWGDYECIDIADRYQVKRITVKPGASLSLQMHYHRAEHWIVVRGTALITCGEETRTIAENQSTYIPLGMAHRLENPGKIPLELIEVQSGSYLGEDDIVRFDDRYGR
jgi:mannose-1-phosphate guanylyltransferase/mannose-6-phosphate isomerase